MSIMASEILDHVERLRARGEEFCVATVVRTADATSAKAGAKAVVAGDGAILGFVGGACVQGSVRRAAMGVLLTGKARLIRVKPKDTIVTGNDSEGVELHSSACPSGGTVDLFIEPVLRAPLLVVMGASPVGAALVSLANAMGYRTIVVCPESDRGLMPGADTYERSLGRTARGDSLVVATQGRGDRRALESAAASDASYVAFVGSGRKAGTLKRQLAAAGVDEAALSRVKSPAGLDIGAIEPEEIAVSIIGEMILRRRHSAALEMQRDSAAADPREETSGN